MRGSERVKISIKPYIKLWLYIYKKNQYLLCIFAFYKVLFVKHAYNEERTVQGSDITKS